ncbi:MAG: hypothetical protein DRP50_05155 [Thermotoga sp.]|nr:MAG: hypothetical protein DRP50_05155 [Thermotoga sp.]
MASPSLSLGLVSRGGVKFILPLRNGKSLTLTDIQTAYSFDTFAGRGRLGAEAAVSVFFKINRFAVVPSFLQNLVRGNYEKYLRRGQDHIINDIIKTYIIQDVESHRNGKKEYE